MRILFASGNGYIPEFSGGVQSNTDHLARELQARGHEIGVLAALFGDGLAGLRARLALKVTRRAYAVDHIHGYRVLRAWTPEAAVDEVVAGWNPDVAVVQCHRSVAIGRSLMRHGVPLVVYLHNVEFDELAGDPRELAGATFIANSAFTADAYRKAFGIEAVVIPPAIDKAVFATPTSREFVTFINIDEKKGVGKAIEIARDNPDIPFLFVESWVLGREALKAFAARTSDLSNVTFMRRQSDMAKVYGRTRILLAPSRWEEAWGRVASEAHCSGIPVIGSNRGGLPDAIGTGGAVLDYDAPVYTWSGVLRELWFDEALYEEVSARAKDYADRPVLDTDHQVQTLMSLIAGAVAYPAADRI